MWSRRISTLRVPCSVAHLMENSYLHHLEAEKAGFIDQRIDHIHGLEAGFLYSE